MSMIIHFLFFAFEIISGCFDFLLVVILIEQTVMLYALISVYIQKDSKWPWFVNDDMLHMETKKNDIIVIDNQENSGWYVCLFGDIKWEIIKVIGRSEYIYTNQSYLHWWCESILTWSKSVIDI